MTYAAAKNGPFEIRSTGYLEGWDIVGADGVPICHIGAQLIDACALTDKYPDGIIRSRDQRKDEVQFICSAMNYAWWSSTQT